ncbi:hypothetical protein V3C99_016468, partial [Haemonchus contortus]
GARRGRRRGGVARLG